MYLMDTDILRNIVKRSPSTALIARLGGVPVHQQFTSSVTLRELIYGIRHLGAQGEHLAERLEERLLANLPVLPFDTEAARRYGTIRAELERMGSPLGDADLRIAAIALSRALVLVTGNVRHFQRVPGLEIENWLEE